MFKMSRLACDGTNIRRFNSFAVLDLETANLPQNNYNKVGITELSIYGIAAEELEKAKDGAEIDGPPKLPRVLHKLTLMINPYMAIVPDAEKVTGLNNFMLERESKFDENAASTVLSFLNHLRHPICLVAHNGWFFDFPIVQHVLEKVKTMMPETVYCVDSLRAFHDIDQIRLLRSKTIVIPEENSVASENCDVKNVLQAETKFDARALNETTPKRLTLSITSTTIKRKRKPNYADQNNEHSDEECEDFESKTFKSKRSLNFGDSILTTPANITEEANISYLVPDGKRWYPPKNIYKLGNLYKRTFQQEPKQTHYAEADVILLTQLILHYGNDFIEYAEQHAIPFVSIPPVGKKIL